LARNRRGRSGTDRRCGVAYRGWRFLASPARLGAEEETPWLGCQRHADAGGRQRGPRRRRGIACAIALDGKQLMPYTMLV